jgi:hypothetical protein
MKSKGAIFTIIFTAAILALVLPWVFSHKEQSVGPLTFETREISYSRAGKDNRDTYSIKATYPFFTGGFSDEIGSKINNTLTASVRSVTLAIKTDFETEYGSKDEANTYVPQEPLTYEGESEVSADLGRLPFANVTLTGYQYSGGAHGITVISTSVFDTRTGDEITLPTLFEGDYLNTLSRLSLAELKRIDPDMTTFTFAEDGTLPDKDNFSAFSLEPDGLHLIFQDYQVAPYVAGEPEIVIPYSSLSEVIALKYKSLLK